MHSPEALIDRFRGNGLKVTPQRQAVFQALYRDTTHPTAEVIWDRVRAQMPSVSRRTVYQVLNDLVDLGEVQVVTVANGPTLFDPNVALHDHFVCNQCASVIDVDAGARAEMPRSGYSGFEVDSAEVVFRGKCPDCATPTSIDSNPSGDHPQ